MDETLHYLQEKYHPLSVILYGSYANGTNTENSDFDALVISAGHESFHDTSLVGNVQLDVFVYPAAYFEKPVDYEDFVQIFDGRILADTNGIGKTLQASVQTYLRNRPVKTRAEIQANIDWCIKMGKRAKRCDCEGMFRWHWVLIDSLEIFCDVMRHPYWGPKKSLKWMEETHPEAFQRYQKALSHFRMDCLEDWIDYLRRANEQVNG